MRKRARIILLVGLALLVLSPLAAYWALNAWLESSGGREMLERNLSARTGMNVVLGGAFDLMLLPDIGVNGTNLVIESMPSEGPLARSDEYEISVALKPLLNGQVQIDWIRLSGGEIHPGRYRAMQPGEGENASSSGVPVLEIEELTVRDFRIVSPGGGNAGFTVDALTVSGFADRREAPFILEIQDLATVKGSLLPDMEEYTLKLDQLSLERSGQRLAGQACLDLGEPFSLHLVLEAGQLDLDRLQDGLPEMESWAGSGDQEAPSDIRIRLSVDELTASGAVARGVVLSLGEEPVCGSG